MSYSKKQREELKEYEKLQNDLFGNDALTSLDMTDPKVQRFNYLSLKLSKLLSKIMTKF